MCPFVGVVVGVVGRVQDRKCLGTTWVPTGQTFRQKDKSSAIRQGQKQAVTEFRTPGVQSDRKRQEHQKSQKSGISNTTRRCTLLTHPPSATPSMPSWP